MYLKSINNNLRNIFISYHETSQIYNKKSHNVVKNRKKLHSVINYKEQGLCTHMLRPIVTRTCILCLDHVSFYDIVKCYSTTTQHIISGKHISSSMRVPHNQVHNHKLLFIFIERKHIEMLKNVLVLLVFSQHHFSS
jgi:hypothetical protein